MSQSSLKTERRKVAELECVIIDSPGCDESIRGLVLLCHGFGAPGEDLVPCAAELFAAVPNQLRGVRFVFPAAPIVMDTSGMFDARAWWPIDMDQLQKIMESKAVRDLRKEKPDLLPARRQQLMEVMDAVQREAGINPAKTIIGGFSQGAMLATDVALAFPETLGGLIIWSGTLLNEKEWKRLAPDKTGLKVVQSHGKEDPILPFEGAEWLRSVFAINQIKNNFIPFPGQHTIPLQAITAAAEMIHSVVE